MKAWPILIALVFQAQAKDILNFNMRGNHDQNTIGVNPEDDICTLKEQEQKVDLALRAVLSADHGIDVVKDTVGERIENTNDQNIIIKWPLGLINRERVFMVSFNRMCRVMAVESINDKRPVEYGEKDELCPLSTRNYKAEVAVKSILLGEHGVESIVQSDGGAIPHVDESKYIEVKWEVFRSKLEDEEKMNEFPERSTYKTYYDESCEIKFVDFTEYNI